MKSACCVLMIRIKARCSPGGNLSDKNQYKNHGSEQPLQQES